MIKPPAPRPFLVINNHPSPTGSSEFTDDDLRSAFEHIPDLDSLDDDQEEKDA